MLTRKLASYPGTSGKRRLREVLRGEICGDRTGPTQGLACSPRRGGRSEGTGLSRIECDRCRDTPFPTARSAKRVSGFRAPSIYCLSRPRQRYNARGFRSDCLRGMDFFAPRLPPPREHGRPDKFGPQDWAVGFITASQSSHRRGWDPWVGPGERKLPLRNTPRPQMRCANAGTGLPCRRHRSRRAAAPASATRCGAYGALPTVASQAMGSASGCRA